MLKFNRMPSQDRDNSFEPKEKTVTFDFLKQDLESVDVTQPKHFSRDTYEVIEQSGRTGYEMLEGGERSIMQGLYDKKLTEYWEFQIEQTDSLSDLGSKQTHIEGIIEKIKQAPFQVEESREDSLRAAQAKKKAIQP